MRHASSRPLHLAVLLIAATILVASTGALAASPGVETGLIKVGDANIQYFSQGQGEVVVLLPGGSLTVGYMEGLAKALADAGYRAVRINCHVAHAGRRCRRRN